MLAAEDVQRQVTIILVVAVKEPTRLVAVNQVIRRVQVQDDALRWRVVRSKEQAAARTMDRMLMPRNRAQGAS